ncbi:hypothetical protein FQZ97_927900 [compost metagenome]
MALEVKDRQKHSSTALGMHGPKHRIEHLLARDPMVDAVAWPVDLVAEVEDVLVQPSTSPHLPRRQGVQDDQLIVPADRGECQRHGASGSLFYGQKETPWCAVRVTYPPEAWRLWSRASVKGGISPCNPFQETRPTTSGLSVGGLQIDTGYPPGSANERGRKRREGLHQLRHALHRDDEQPAGSWRSRQGIRTRPTPSQ